MNDDSTKPVVASDSKKFDSHRSPEIHQGNEFQYQASGPSISLDGCCANNSSSQ